MGIVKPPVLPRVEPQQLCNFLVLITFGVGALTGKSAETAADTTRANTLAESVAVIAADLLLLGLSVNTLGKGYKYVDQGLIYIVGQNVR